MLALQSEVVKLVNARAILLFDLNEKVAALENQQTLTQNEWAAVDAEYQADRTNYSAIVIPKIGDYLRARLSSEVRVQQVTASDFKVFDDGVLRLLQRSKDVRERIRLLQFKIEGINT